MNTKFLLDFVDWYEKSNGCKLSIVATGGGMSLGQITSVPGSSSIFHSFYVPYATAETVEFIRKNYPIVKAESFEEKAVCSESAKNLFYALWTKNKVDGHLHIHNIAVTAAITSTRWRRGDNKAFIFFENLTAFRDECWYLKLPKLTEAEHNSKTREELMAVRNSEENLLAEVTLCLATQYESDTVKKLVENGTLTSIPTTVNG